MFAWRFLDDDGTELGVSERFADRESAESWIGLSWADLYERGVKEVVLFDEDRRERLYRMGLGEGS
jgi:hypothetical protein